MAGRRILISGLGIAGPALAFWLQKQGDKVEFVETASAPREGGYGIDIWGMGFDAIERMGLTGALQEIGYKFGELREVNDEGKRVSGFSGHTLERAMGGRYMTVLRSDLSRMILAKLDDCPIRFGEEIAAIDDLGGEVAVRFSGGGEARYDLVVGADGLHSRVRELVLGEGGIARLGYRVAAFIARDYPHRDPDCYVSHTEPHRMIGRYALRDGLTAFLFVWRAEKKPLKGGHDVLERAYAGMDWEWPEIRDALRKTDDLYIDDIAQTRLDRWSKGRVVLLGDAAFCPSLLAGEGSAMAMTGANILAAKMAEGGHEQAFAAYEATLREPFGKIQKGALYFAGQFAPKSRFALWIRNQAMKLMNVGPISGPLIRRTFSSHFDWPDDALSA